jgi:S-adenosylmethionine decarboxylase
MKTVKQIKILGLGDFELLNNESYIKEFMISLVHKIGMQVLDRPLLYNVPLQIEKLGLEPFVDSGGITCQLIGYVVLSTSHLSWHSFPLENKFYLDIFSCREFELDRIKDFVYDVFKCHKIKITDLSEACEW